MRERQEILIALNWELGTTISAQFSQIGDKLTLPRIHEFDGEIRRVQDKKRDRILQINHLVRSILDLWEDVGFHSNDCHTALERDIASLRGSEQSYHTKTLITNEVLEELQTIKRAAEKLKYCRQQEIMGLWTQIEILREELQLDIDDNDPWLSRSNECTLTALTAMKNEADRLEKLKESTIEVRTHTLPYRQICIHSYPFHMLQYNSLPT